MEFVLYPGIQITWAMSQLRQLVAGFPTAAALVDTSPGHVGFVLDKMLLRQFSLSTSVSLVISPSPNCSTFVNHPSMDLYTLDTGSDKLSLNSMFEGKNTFACNAFCISSQVQSSKLLLTLASTAVLGFEPHRYP
jgi:hypothetical protein